MFVPRTKPGVGDLEAWQKRIDAFNWHLLPHELGIHNRDTAIHPESELDCDLFLASVRAADMFNLQVEKERNPFSYRFHGSGWTTKFFFANAAYCRRMLLRDARRAATTIALPENFLGEYMLDRARYLLEADDEHRKEQETLFDARWMAVAKGHACPPLPARVPLTDAEYPQAKLAVLQRAPEPLSEPRLSPGGASVCALANHLGFPGCLEALIGLEQAYHGVLVPAGMEMQIPAVAHGTTFAWKQALRSFGIPSPRRPEYMNTVEAAFRPARSFHSLLLAPLLIAKLGIPDKEQDVAVHISFQGDLGVDVRFLALPLLLMKKSRRDRTPDARLHESMARLMSKGFVHCNKDVEQVPGAAEAACRTEIRVFGCTMELVDGRIQPILSYVPLVIAAHLLVSAALSDKPEALAAWADYKTAVQAYVTTLPPEFGTMLNADWYQATGDPRDGRLVALLPTMHYFEVC